MLVKTQDNINKIEKLVKEKILPTNFLHSEIPLGFDDNEWGKSVLSSIGFCLFIMIG